jgi:hypothetical protein
LDLSEIIGDDESDKAQAEAEQKLFEQAQQMQRLAEENAAASDLESVGEDLAPSAADPTAIPEF